MVAIRGMPLAGKEEPVPGQHIIGAQGFNPAYETA